MGSHAAPRHVRTADDHLDQVRTLFDTKAAGWQAKYEPDGRLAGRLSQLARAVGDRTDAGAAVLDLGCGSGELARRLAASGYRVTGCDIAPGMLYRAQAADAWRAVRWIRLEPSWQALPFAAGSVDTVVCASVLEYVRDPGQVLAECAHTRGWQVHLFDVKGVEAQAARLLGERARDVLHRPRATLGPPWTKDHRIALASTILAS